MLNDMKHGAVFLRQLSFLVARVVNCVFDCG